MAFLKPKRVILRGTRAAQPLATDVAEGSLYYVTDEAVTERSTSLVWEDVTDGGSGPAGLDGAMGAPGLDGEPGEDATGLGPVGPQGPAGAAGPTGVAGPMGAPGTDGTDGDDGAMGPPGATGATGTPGSAGAAGAPGSPGLDGTDGDDGAIGPPGPAGAAGSAGAAGAVGPMGPPGWPDDPDDPILIPGPQGATGASGGGGGGGTTGIASLNFGAFPGASDAAVVVTGQAAIVGGSIVQAWLRPEATADHTADEHMLETIAIHAGNIVAGTGFTIYAFNTSQINEPGTEVFGRPEGYRGVNLPVGAGPSPITGSGGNSSNRGRAYVAGKGTLIYGLWSVQWRWS